MRPRTVHVSIDINSGVRLFNVSNPNKQPAPRKKSGRVQALRFAVLILIVSVVAFSTGIFNTHANTTHLYPSVCLGGWADSQFAERTPNALEGTWITKHNAAYLASTSAAQIFCGRFYGDIPEETTPTAVRAKLFLAELQPRVDVSPISLPVEESVVASTTLNQSATSTITNGTATSTDEQSIKEVKGVTPIEENINASSTEEVSVPRDEALEAAEENSFEEVLAPEETSWWRSLILPVAYAEEVSTSTAVDHVEESLPQGTDTATSSGNSKEEFLQLENEIVSTTTPEFETATTTQDIAPDVATTSEEVRTASLADFETGTTTASSSGPEGIVAGVASKEKGDPFLEVSVSIAGGARAVVDVISRDEFNSAEFDIPLPENFTWADFEQFEISIERVAALGDQPDVLLDGVQLEVSYEPVQKDASVSLTVLDRLSDAVGLSIDVASSTELVATSSATTTSLSVPEIVGPLPERAVSLDVFIDPDAKHSCAVDPFSISVTEIATTTAFVLLTGVAGEQSKLTIGSLPRGIDVMFSENNEYEYTASTQTREVSLSITRFYGAQKGIFSIPIVYTLIDRQSSIECQMVIDNS